MWKYRFYMYIWLTNVNDGERLGSYLIASVLPSMTDCPSVFSRPPLVKGDYSQVHVFSVLFPSTKIQSFPAHSIHRQEAVYISDVCVLCSVTAGIVISLDLVCLQPIQACLSSRRVKMRFLVFLVEYRFLFQRPKKRVPVFVQSHFVMYCAG